MAEDTLSGDLPDASFEIISLDLGSLASIKAINDLWMVSERETGIALDVSGAERLLTSSA